MMIKTLTDTERRDWLRLWRTDKIGPVTFRDLLRKFGTASDALKALPALAAKGGAKQFLVAENSIIDREIDTMRQRKGRFIAWCEPDYPEALRFCEDAPAVLSVLGHASLLNKPCLGVVGARNASLSGRKMAERLAHDLGQQGYVIVSGLARGIDTAAHHASLETGTIAVLAGGADVVYPEENRALYDKIIATGTVVSDQPLGGEPRAILFPRRNRIISGLSRGIVVVEAAKKSGSLITARYALEQGREIFAVPGSPLDARAGGTNDLLRQGAILTETARDVTTHLQSLPQRLTEPKTHPLDMPPLPQPSEADLAAAREKILEILSPCPVTVDELVRECQISFPIAATLLLELELAGRLERQAGNRVSLIL